MAIESVAWADNEGAADSVALADIVELLLGRDCVGFIPMDNR